MRQCVQDRLENTREISRQREAQNGDSVQELKFAARMQKWSLRIAECRSSGMSVRAWCEEQGIAVQTYYHWEKRFVTKATQQFNLPVPTQAGLLMRVNPDTLPSDAVNTVGFGITIRYGDSIITLADNNAGSDGADSINRQCIRIHSHEHSGLRGCWEAELLGGLGAEVLAEVVVCFDWNILLVAPGPYRHPARAAFRDLR